jgi:hypothetical protein
MEYVLSDSLVVPTGHAWRNRPHPHSLLAVLECDSREMGHRHLGSEPRVIYFLSELVDLLGLREKKPTSLRILHLDVQRLSHLAYIFTLKPQH